MAVSQQNRLRWRAILIGRDVKALFAGMPERWRERPPAWWILLRALRSPRAMLWRWLFLGPDGRPHRAGEILLADLRDYCGLGDGRSTIFDPDPHVVAFREGKRAVFMRIANYLNLDEGMVQKLMELDDGLGE